MTSYKDQIHLAMQKLAEYEKVRFIGYGVRYGSQGAGTFKGIPEHKLIETPLAENLMVGMAIGLSMEGFLPVVYIERFDFITNAMDAIVNHLDKIAQLSDNEFRPTAILRVVVGNKKKPLFTGATHTQDFTDAMRRMVNFPIVQLHLKEFIEGHYAVAGLSAAGRTNSTMLVEYKDDYGS